MIYSQKVILRGGVEALLRNADGADALAVRDNFNQTHGETDYLLTYPGEASHDPVQEAQFLADATASANAIQIMAVIQGEVAGTAGIEPVGQRDKVKHRAEFGLSILQAYWGLGLGRVLSEACIQCARAAGYDQLELQVVAGNERALSLYRRLGFVEFGRNPHGFKTRTGDYQELIYMLLTL